MAELLFREDPYLKACDATVVAVHGDAVELDRTVFYPLGGGQAGDRGRIGSSRVLDTRKGPTGDSVLHILEPGASPQAGSKVQLALDWGCKVSIDTDAHAPGQLEWQPYGCDKAARMGIEPSEIVNTLSAGRINDDKAHLDFDIEMERLVKDAIEQQLNALVESAVETQARWITDAELEARPELVKTMSVAPPRGEGRVRLMEIPGIDLQACGGTHVRNTAEVGRLAVARIRSEGKRNKRVTLELR